MGEAGNRHLEPGLDHNPPDAMTCSSKPSVGHAPGPWSRFRPLGLALALALMAPTAEALLIAPFGPNGEGGDVNGQLFALGGGGRVHELDAFVALAGQDLNGATSGVAARLSQDAPPADLGYAFDAVLFGTGGVRLRYELSNQGATPLPALTFLSFLDAEIVETDNTFFDEFAAVSGAPAPGQSFEVDEPGFVSGDLFDHLLLAMLDDTNARTAASPDDVAMALGFSLGVLQPGAAAVIDIVISEAGDSLGGVRIDHFDPDDATVITYSGEAARVPEPATSALLGLGLAVALAARRPTRR